MTESNNSVSAGDMQAAFIGGLMAHIIVIVNTAVKVAVSASVFLFAFWAWGVFPILEGMGFENPASVAGPLSAILALVGTFVVIRTHAGTRELLKDLKLKLGLDTNPQLTFEGCANALFPFEYIWVCVQLVIVITILTPFFRMVF